MLKAIGQRFVSLGRDEEGVAFVVTIAVFFFMYLMIAGVYAVGTAVKERVQLQNACDAAAYSAAVVQADTLSRIATLNRAMAWTYVSMTRRQMDWVTYKWMKEVVAHWDDDKNHAMLHCAIQPAQCSNPAHHLPDWHCDTTLTLRAASGAKTVNVEVARRGLASFNSLNRFADRSFYSSPDSFTGQITNDRRSIEEMNKAIDWLMAPKNYIAAVDDAITGILRANGVGVKNLRYVGEFVGLNQVLTSLSNDEAGESQFIQFLQESLQSAFGNSGRIWFTRDNAPGFRRKYKTSDNVLSASWTWHSTKWQCTPATQYTPEIHIPICASCNHPKHHLDLCSCRLSSSFFGRQNYKAMVLADNNRSKDEYYGTPTQYAANPRVLLPSYFGKAGTITVGLARKNENPWLSLLGRAGTALGIYSAFNPFCQWSWAFASAKAGYKYLGEEDYEFCAEDGNWYPNRAYRIDWNDRNGLAKWSDSEQSWNLCQSDWDAVMVPVRCAESTARDRAWRIGNTRMLYDYVVEDQDKWRWLDVDDERDEIIPDDWGRMMAGGTRTISKIRDLGPGDDPWEWVNDIPRAYDNNGRVSAQWQIGNPGGRLHWERLAERMFH